MSQYSRYFARYYSASKITGITVKESLVILTVESLDGTDAETSLTIQQFYDIKPVIGKYLVVDGDVAASVVDEAHLQLLGKEITLEEAEAFFSAPGAEGFRTPPPQ